MNDETGGSTGMTWNEHGSLGWSAQSEAGGSLTIVEDEELHGMYRLLCVDVTGELEYATVLPTVEFAKEVAEQWVEATS